jgi:hypothetical protein
MGKFNQLMYWDYNELFIKEKSGWKMQGKMEWNFIGVGHKMTSILETFYTLSCKERLSDGIKDITLLVYKFTESTISH